MAYRRKTKKTYRRTYKARKPRKVARRAAPRAQTIRIVLEQASPVMSDPMAGNSRVPVNISQLRKARF